MSVTLPEVEAALRAAYDRCAYRRARGTWAGGEHEVRVEVIDADLLAREEAAIEEAARVMVEREAYALVCAALGPTATLDLLSPARMRARLSADEGAERRRAEVAHALRPRAPASCACCAG